MVKPTNNEKTGKIDRRDNAKTFVKPDSDLLAVRASRANEINQTEDLIVSLSNEYENKRARQVFEWESVRRRNLHHAA